MEMAERAHLRLSPPAGRLAVLKARKIVLPGYGHCQLTVGNVKEHTCLHAHEDAPSIVRARIDHASDEAAYKQREVSVFDTDCLHEITTNSIS